MKRRLIVKLALCLLFCVEGLCLNAQNTQTFRIKKLQRMAQKLPASVWTSKDSLQSISSLSIPSAVKICRDRSGQVTHLGVNVFNADARQMLGVAFSNFVERTLLEILLADSEQDAALLVGEYKVSLQQDGKAQTTTPKRWTRAFLADVKQLKDMNINRSDKAYTIRWHNQGNHAYVFSVAITREAIEGTAKVEAEELVLKTLSQLPTSNYVPQTPKTKELSKQASTDLLVRKGTSYVLSTVNSDTYYTLRQGKIVAAFDANYPIESLKNLMQGVLNNNPYKLHIAVSTYSGEKTLKNISLKDFIDYWKTNPDYDIYCGVGEKQANEDSAPYTVVMFINHKYLQYSNLLTIPVKVSAFTKKDEPLEGILTTNIPLHNISHLY